ncbi:LysR family transcriptional regulator [Pseudomonas borbori]|uniref:DNA-binding transcriptional regulator, LysR family n=1 Tax=Pseudomonas borbori TaxID=289003 RepID=A0A1I5RYF8_9PSED|nr:LysR family transcriptional regulator [Pseudomonas borbori]SFP63503.1 DNA-binding transcriptional regulator, LysR family [Pseudomonas borbori]
MINFRLIRHLWLFLAVAEEQSFSRAAKRLGMSQPPLTEQIQILEHALKIKLFERSRQGAKLTPAGSAILPSVRKFAEQLGRLELAVLEAVSGQAGVLTIGAITNAMIDVLPPLIDRFKTEHPQITVAVREIDSAEAIPALESGDIDLAFARLEGNLGKNLRCVALTEDRLAVAVPRDHPLASRARLTLANLVDEPLVMSSRQVSPNYFDYLIGVCKANGLSPRVLHEVRSVTSQIAFVSCGQGVALVPASMKKLAPDNVILKPLTPKLSVVTTAAVWNSARANPLVDALVALLAVNTLVAAVP